MSLEKVAEIQTDRDRHALERQVRSGEKRNRNRGNENNNNRDNRDNRDDDSNLSQREEGMKRRWVPRSQDIQ